jgi:hypothetical protein|tara:strand:- start:197 stop:334 length:138 start_codon:yes stop_codon:yes gene_type:complete
MRTTTGQVIHESVKKKTSIGRGNVGFSTMNKRKKQTYKAYRGQGK